MAVSQGFQVTPARTAPLAAALPPVTTGGVDSAAFRVDLATPMVQGIAAGLALTRPLADAAADFSPIKIAERTLALRQLAAKNEMIGPETELAKQQLRIQQTMAQGNQAAMDRLTGRSTASGPLSNAQAPQSEAPSQGPLSNAGGLSPIDDSPQAKRVLSDAFAQQGVEQSPSSPIAAQPTVDPDAQRSATIQQENQRLADITRMAQIPEYGIEAKNTEAINTEFRKYGDPSAHTMAEKLAMIQQASPLAVEGRKAQSSESENWIKNKEVQDYHIALGSLKGMELLQKAWKPGSPDAAANDFTLTYRYMRTIDPMMGVRESQQEAAQHIGSLPQKWQGLATKVMNGGTLTKEQREGMINAATLAIKGSRPGYEALHAGAAKRIKLAGGDPSALDDMAEEHIAANTGLVDQRGDVIPGTENTPISGGITRPVTVKSGNVVTPVARR